MLSKSNFLFNPLKTVSPLDEEENKKTEEENVSTEDSDSKTVSVKSSFSHIQTA